MRDWLTIELVLATLLVTSFTCVGLLALWAATSSRHWFVRAAVVLAVLSPLLIIPAYEPFLIFVVQAVCIAIGINVYRWWRNRRQGIATRRSDGNPELQRPTIHFSMSWALLATALVATAVAIAVRIPRDVWIGLPTYLLTGATFALAALLAAWLAHGQRCAMHRIAIAALINLAIAIPLAYFNDWPGSVTDMLQPEDFANWPNITTPFLSFLTKIWLTVVPAVVLALTLMLLLKRAMRDENRVRDASVKALPRHLLAAWSFGILALLILLPPLATCWKLLHPLPMPTVELPSPNGYDDLVAAGKMFTSPILNTAVEPKSTAELAAEVAKYGAAYDRARLGLSREVVVPLAAPLMDRYSTLVDDAGEIRNISYALDMEFELARRQDHYSDAASIAADNVRLGRAVSNTGLLTQWLTGIVYESIGLADIYRISNQMTAEDRRALSVKLYELEMRREPLSVTFRRDRAFNESAYGWSGHLFHLLWDISGDWTSKDVQTVLYPRAVAESKLLITELAVREYLHDHGAPPESLQQLVPAYIPTVLTDPFDSSAGPFRYRSHGDTFLLYSVATDGDDDGGRPLPRNEYGGIDMTADGDLRLDVHFAPDDDGGSQNGQVAEREATEEKPVATDDGR